VKFTNLRMTGFKSFVEPTDFEIHEGLTGIVGPNGCGKSNVLEALRWVMGATSAKALRGDGMESVIFSGTTMRPQRNWAEVTLTLDNKDRTAPAEYNELDTIEITRRILRKEDGTQSIYKINNKDVRAKDVQLFFADASSGANSPALVRQGQVAELINAKPQNRRRILEEAAGITGLHSRRHEAELRLRAAETNLSRLDDVMGELDGQKAALARQARQATRYRNISGDIRRTEAMANFLRWQEATTNAAQTQKELEGVAGFIEETALAATKAGTAREDAHSKLDPLRMKETESGAALHRLTVARENLDDEATRAEAELNRLAGEIERVEADLAREKTLLADAEEAINALNREEEGLRQRETSEAERLVEAEATMSQTAEALSQRETEFETSSRESAEQEAKRKALTTRINETKHRVEKFNRQINELKSERQRVAPEADEAAALNAAKLAFTTIIEAVGRAETQQQVCEEARAQAEAEEVSTRAPLRQAEQALSEIEAERDALTKLLTDHGADWTALIEQIDVEPGLENALAAALGDDLNAATDSQAPAYWSMVGREKLDAEYSGKFMGNTPHSFPNGVMPLCHFVKAPPELARRLHMVGVVAKEMGNRLHSSLKPGQRLVTREGDLWRWDGFVARAEARTAAAIRLEQRNRLYALEDEHQDAQQRVNDARAIYDKAAEQLQNCKTNSANARQTFVTTRRESEEKRSIFERLEKAFEKASARIHAIDENLDRLNTEKSERHDHLTNLSSEVEELPDPVALTQKLSQARDSLSRARGEASEARAAHGDLAREAHMRTERLGELTRERGVWATRGETANGRIENLGNTLDQVREAHQTAQSAPAAIDEKRKILLTQIGTAETTRNEAADQLARAQAHAQEMDKAVRLAEEAASEAREARARLEAQAEAAIARVGEATELAREACNAEPEQLLEISEHKEGKELPTRADIEKKLERYKRERENLGGVNLRADEELQEIATRLEEFSVEREDCEGAIAKLRTSIRSLNKEARQRLLDAFETVNTNFSRLFTTLFNGGQAELRLVDADDPLEAGLEIYASPPGKKLTSMSLMSGGEQALTATSLIFAVFMANTAPVCVLDEVDAPLDDANTERFCRMLQEMVQETQTRFVVITHHPLSMSRMDRLFGVTMIERGVSQLVSVDLSGAEQLAAAE